VTEQTENTNLTTALQGYVRHDLDAKAKRYVGKFFDGKRRGNSIVARVVGNHGTYTVSLNIKGATVNGACSCYIGRYGCHHCTALAQTYLNDPASFEEIKRRQRRSVRTLEDLEAYLEGVTLEELLEQLKAQGVTQKAFADSINMSSAHLSAVKRSELRHHYFHELGATKLACLWVMENFKPSARKASAKKATGKKAKKR
jgi:uncharacterized Zn finger protein